MVSTNEAHRQPAPMETSEVGVSSPTVSVIVSTHNRAKSLSGLLNALMAQVYPSQKMEVIVVDNDSTDDTASVVQEAADRATFPIRYIRKPNAGPAAARNVGAAQARGAFLAFTDSDCLPSPGWLARAISAFGPNDGLACGPIIPVDGDGDALLVHQMPLIDEDRGIYPTANIVYRRSAFVEAGGFDEQYGAYGWGPPVGGEDTDLGWRIRRAGYGATFAPLATVYHQSTPIGVREWLLSPVKAQIVPRLVAKIPELRHTFLWHRYFLGRHTATFYLAGIGLALARRNRLSLLLAVPWLRVIWPLLRADAWPPRRWPRLSLKVALQFQASFVLTLVLLWASVRHRRLVL